MMCKYYWCAGYIKEPPHLPIDSINLKNAGIKGKDMVNWTEIEEPQVYINLINKIKEKHPGNPLLNGKWITGTDVTINLYRMKSKKNQKKLKNFT